MHRLLSAGTAAISAPYPASRWSWRPPPTWCPRRHRARCRARHPPDRRLRRARRRFPRPDPRATRRHSSGPARATGLLVRVTLPPSVPADAESVASRSRRTGPSLPGSSRCTGAGRRCRTLEPQRPAGGTDLEPGVCRGRCDAGSVRLQRPGTDLIVDLVGWFGDGGSPFQEFAPRRAVDTRSRRCGPPASPASRP